MKIKEIANQYGLDPLALEYFLDRHPEIKTTGLVKNVPDSEIPQLLESFKSEIVAREEQARLKAKEEAERPLRELERQQRELERQKAVASMLVTSGFSFDGYTIKKYSGYISGDDAIQINRSDLFKNKGQILTDSLVLIRINALRELKEAAYDLGCNAVIGVDFDYMTFEPESISNYGGSTTHYYEPYVVCVTANGNAVIIEKN